MSNISLLFVCIFFKDMRQVGSNSEFDVLVQKEIDKRLGIYIQHHSRCISKIVSKDPDCSVSLFVGDIITKVNGKKMNTKKVASTIFKSYPSVTLTIVRNEFYSPLLE